MAKIMAHRGLCSRREAERLIEAGEVRVDGVVIKLGATCSPEADIVVGRRGQGWLADRVTVLLHKPTGIVSTQPEGEQVPAWKLLTEANLSGEADPRLVAKIVAEPWYMAVAGRLDRDSRGLLVLTTDGVLAKRITGGGSGAPIRKRYLVTTDRTATESQLARLRGPLMLDGKRLEPMKIERAGAQLRFELVEGRKHQIRRVCRDVGLDVTDLLRDGIGPWTLAGLPEGRWKLVDGSKLTGR